MILQIKAVRPLVVAALAALVAVAACGPAGKTPTSVSYSVSAQKNYDKGMEQLAAEHWTTAAKYFTFIKSRFPYSKYAVLSELRLADAELGAEEFLEAIDSYKLFAKFHPTHEKVADGYVSYRIGLAYYKQLPGDFWLLPPSYEKDQSPVEDAAEEMRRFVQKYPDSPYRKEAEKIVSEVGKRLAAHEWYVARYYWTRGKPMGTVLRLRRLLDRFAGVGYDEEALWLLGRAYAKVQMPDRAREAWGQLVEKYPQGKRASDARTEIARLPAAAPK